MLISVLMCNFSKYLPLTNICGKFYPKICCSPYLLKFSIKTRCNSSIWRKQDGMKFAHNTLKFSRFVQNYMNDKTFEKINIKIEISIQQSTSVLNFSQFEELQILGPNLHKNMNEKNCEKINIKTVISIQQCTPLRNFIHFEEIQIMAPNLPKKHE